VVPPPEFHGNVPVSATFKLNIKGEDRVHCVEPALTCPLGGNNADLDVGQDVLGGKGLKREVQRAEKGQRKSDVLSSRGGGGVVREGDGRRGYSDDSKTLHDGRLGDHLTQRCTCSHQRKTGRSRGLKKETATASSSSSSSSSMPARVPVSSSLPYSSKQLSSRTTAESRRPSPRPTPSHSSSSPADTNLHTVQKKHCVVGMSDNSPFDYSFLDAMIIQAPIRQHVQRIRKVRQKKELIYLSRYLDIDKDIDIYRERIDNCNFFLLSYYFTTGSTLIAHSQK
tara:strand:- start:275 stop:1120 length:846 start_codon:yes stop_codon:yes gene_type:complete